MVVVQTHLGSGHYGGRVAVIGFYLLSGYLMTLLCCGPYRGRFQAFWANRLIRVFPTYWIIYLASVLWLWRFPATPWGTEVMGNYGWWQILGIVPVHFPQVNPSAWALSVELFWWLAISLGIATTAWRTGLWLMASTVFVVVFGAWPLSDWYTTIWFGSFWFALGAFGSHAGLKLPRDEGWTSLAGAMSYPLFLCHMLVGAIVGHYLGIGRGWPLFFTALLPTLAVSLALVLWVERPIERYRKQIRKPQET